MTNKIYWKVLARILLVIKLPRNGQGQHDDIYDVVLENLTEKSLEPNELSRKQRCSTHLIIDHSNDCEKSDDTSYSHDYMEFYEDILSCLYEE